MKQFKADKYTIRLMNNNNKDELLKVQELRYKYLLRVYNPSLPEEGLDDDGYDQYANSILVIDDTKDVIAGAYRVADLDTLKGHKFLLEDEYDIAPLRESGYNFAELSRAVVHPDYQNGFVIQLLLLAIYHYVIEHNCHFFLGLCSFHGSDPSKYMQGLALLKRDYLYQKYTLKPICNAFPLDYIKEEEIDEIEAKKQLPGLLKMYLAIGHKVGVEGCIDYSFNSCDVLIILDLDNINKRYLERFLRININE